MLLILKRHDWLLNLAVLILAALSLLIIYSVSQEQFFQQLIWFVIGFAAIFLVSQIDWRIIVNYRWMIFGFYAAVVALLLVALFFAPVIRESRSWIVIGNFQFQPSELAKAALIILLAYFFAKRHIGIAHLRNLAMSFIYFLIPALLIFLQPDWGSALVLLGIWIGFLLISGIRSKHLAVGFIIFAVLGIVSWNFFLKDYQRERIIGFLEPAYDPLGVNYSVIQSKIAIGSAGFFGKGFRQGTQAQLGFLTEPSTDFVLAAFIEEWGFLGGLVLIAAFLFLVFRIISVGLRSEDNFSKLFSLGTVILLLVEFGLNVGSNIGFSPVVGVTFPFVSYGGSSLLTKSILIGIIQSLAAKTKF